MLSGAQLKGGADQTADRDLTEIGGAFLGSGYYPTIWCPHCHRAVPAAQRCVCLTSRIRIQTLAVLAERYPSSLSCLLDDHMNEMTEYALVPAALLARLHEALTEQLSYELTCSTHTTAARPADDVREDVEKAARLDELLTGPLRPSRLRSLIAAVSLNQRLTDEQAETKAAALGRPLAVVSALLLYAEAGSPPEPQE